MNKWGGSVTEIRRISFGDVEVESYEDAREKVLNSFAEKGYLVSGEDGKTIIGEVIEMDNDYIEMYRRGNVREHNVDDLVLTKEDVSMNKWGGSVTEIRRISFGDVEAESYEDAREKVLTSFAEKGYLVSGEDGKTIIGEVIEMDNDYIEKYRRGNVKEHNIDDMILTAED